MPRKKKEEVIVRESGIQMHEGMAYIDYAPHLENDPTYIIAMGERSNGKTYGALAYGVEQFVKSGYINQFAYVRRFDSDMKASAMKNLFNGHVKNNYVYQITTGQWEGIKYRAGCFYLSRYDEELDKDVIYDVPVGFTFALNVWEKSKSISYPSVECIIFDEFLTRGGYITDEFVAWMNLISTIARRRTSVLIFMISNTVTKSSLYFREMGLTKIVKSIKQGTIEFHKTKRGTRLSIEYCADANVMSTVNKNVGDVYFGFDNPRINMITKGEWETGMYPHKPLPFVAKNVRFTFYIYWEFEIMRGRIIQVKDENGVTCDFLYFDKYITDDLCKLKKNELIYCTDHSPLPNYRRKITRPTNALEDTICGYFRKEKTFYEDNETGENILNYINWCGNARFI